MSVYVTAVLGQAGVTLLMGVSVVRGGEGIRVTQILMSAAAEPRLHARELTRFVTTPLVPLFVNVWQGTNEMQMTCVKVR